MQNLVWWLKFMPEKHISCKDKNALLAKDNYIELQKIFPRKVGHDAAAPSVDMDRRHCLYPLKSSLKSIHETGGQLQDNERKYVDKNSTCYQFGVSVTLCSILLDILVLPFQPI